jgi:UDP-glucose 4-epimerase
LSKGWIVDVVDDWSGASCAQPPAGVRRFIKGCFSSPIILQAIKRGDYDAVFHLAALPRVSYSVEHPAKTFDTNVVKSLALIEACRFSRPRVVFSSSSSVYGDGAPLPTTESARRNPRSPYALHKSTVEDYLRLYSELYDLDSVCLRYFNVFGPGQLGDSPYSTAIAAWLTAIMRGTPLRSDGDGTQSRDMCYVDNIVDANVLAAEQPHRLRGEAFNIACGETHTNAAILVRLQTLFPWASVVHTPARLGDVHTTHADVSKAFAMLDYRPRVSLWDGLERTVTWFKARPEWSAQNR